MSKTNTVGDSNAKQRPITHITLNTGHRSLVPVDKVDPHELPWLSDLVKTGGGPISPLGEGYRFAVVADDPESCDIIIWKDGTPIITCAFQDASPTAEMNWNQFAEWDYAHPPAFRTCKKVAKPDEPWLAVKLHPTCAMAGSDLPVIAAFEQCVAETWRRLPLAERSPICLPELAKTSAAKRGSSGTQHPSSASPAVADHATEQAVGLVQRNAELNSQLKALRAENQSLKEQQKAISRFADDNTGLRHEADRLRNASSSKDARIQSLEADAEAIRSEIDRRVSEQVGNVRKAAQESELRALVAEDDRAKALRRADKAERLSRRLELLLRKNGIEPAMAFADGDSVSNGEG